MTSQPEIAVVGGGIIGLILAMGLLRQKIPVSLYEQSTGFRELGAGMAFTACARQCMSLINPAITEAFRRSGAVSASDEESDDDYLRWIDGYNQHRTNDPDYQKPLAQIGGNGFQGCRRDHFLEQLARNIPEGVIIFRKRLETLNERDGDGKLMLRFLDGTTAEADAVIGCDGVKSRVRLHLFGPNSLASYPQYTHKVAYRGLVPMHQAIKVLGEWKAHNFHHHIGPGAHLTHYAVANNTAVNVTVFLSDPDPWPDHSIMVATGTRDEVVDALRAWHPAVLGLVRLLPSQLVKWALFDMAEYPAPQYNVGRICIAGDAAHASSPHHGAGACLGVEDALCLSTLLGQACKTVRAVNSTDHQHPSVHLNQALVAAFETYDAVRRTRTQWLVNSSRRACDLYHQAEWGDPSRFIKAMTCFEELRDRSYKIWHFDPEDMVQQSLEEYEINLQRIVKKQSLPT